MLLLLFFSVWRVLLDGINEATANLIVLKSIQTEQGLVTAGCNRAVQTGREEAFQQGGGQCSNTMLSHSTPSAPWWPPRRHPAGSRSPAMSTTSTAASLGSGRTARRRASGSCTGKKPLRLRHLLIPNRGRHLSWNLQAGWRLKDVLGHVPNFS